ncbi:hypothetical protein [Streptomyces sp. MST-110588]|uniref:hypothetical protein n=1 Tax=Streptomyces sp. MST-110588 TaxID=2833628 RepID=UPI001F5C5C01|nr:hypothetical protein [Streptomyces sp. MST-110588]UNO42178.1 hypothetical protein KGS77_24985 [Streptomyces sp. MST-110588]
MGYDIYIQTTDGKPADGDENYFRFAWTAMPRILDAMNDFGMLVELPVPSYPELSAYGLTEEDLKPGTQPDHATATRIAEYRAAYLAVKDASESEPKGIPAYKLRYDDGFLVTVAEITAALTIYEAQPHVGIAEMPVGDHTWRLWVNFLRRAKERGGLRTH